MAKKKNVLFPLETKIELIAIKGDKIFKRIMTYEEAINLPRKKGWKYKYYQIGFSQYNN